MSFSTNHCYKCGCAIQLDDAMHILGEDTYCDVCAKEAGYIPPVVRRRKPELYGDDWADGVSSALLRQGGQINSLRGEIISLRNEVVRLQQAASPAGSVFVNGLRADAKVTSSRVTTAVDEHACQGCGTPEGELHGVCCPVMEAERKAAVDEQLGDDEPKYAAWQEGGYCEKCGINCRRGFEPMPCRVEGCPKR